MACAASGAMSPFGSDPIGLPGLAAFATGALLFLLALLYARRGREPGDAVAGARASSAGIALQGLGIALAAYGPVLVELDPLGARALGEAAAVGSLMAAAVALFAWAAHTLGRNWSLRARTRADHQLVQDGPFRYLRHPIYAAMALFLVALALALGHTRQLAVGLPVFALGTWLRVRSEEALLRRSFGTAYDAYAARVRRFGLF